MMLVQKYVVLSLGTMLSQFTAFRLIGKTQVLKKRRNSLILLYFKETEEHEALKTR